MVSFSSASASEIELVRIDEGVREDLVHLGHGNELEGVADLLRDFFEVDGIALREDDALDSRAVRCEDLLFDTADRQDPAAEGDLAGHGDVVTHLANALSTSTPGPSNMVTPALGPSFGMAPAGMCRCRSPALQEVLADVTPKASRMGAHEGLRAAWARLLHHVAELPGHDGGCPCRACASPR